MNTLRNTLVAVMILFAGGIALADFRVSVGTDDFYVSVGKYDHYPYGVPYGHRPRISFYDVMSDYGSWGYVPSFGRVWRPYADSRWRPYVYGHWTYTQYGPTWQGYEPWAWVGYHYGNWIWTANLGWVWVPGYDWHPGRVAWSHGPTAIGWTPMPPSGYDYCGGSIHHHGGYNQYTYNDPNYGYDDGYYRYDNGYDRYDSRYGQLYGSPSYTNISVNLWVFINKDHYGRDNYADYYLDRNYTRDLFNKRAVRISSAPVQRTQFERIVKQRITEVPVEVREIETERKSVKLIIPKGEEEHIRKNANRVVRDVIAPAYEKEHRSFNRSNSGNEKVMERIFKQAPSARLHEEKPAVKHVEKEEVRRSSNGFPERIQFQGPPERKEPVKTHSSVIEREQTFRDSRESKYVAPERTYTSDRYRAVGPPERKEPAKTHSSVIERERETTRDSRESKYVAPERTYTSDRYRAVGPPQHVETVERKDNRSDVRREPEKRMEREEPEIRVERRSEDAGRNSDLKKDEEKVRQKDNDKDEDRKSNSKKKSSKDDNKRARDDRH